MEVIGDLQKKNREKMEGGPAAKQLNLTMKLGPIEWQHSVKHSVCVRELKQQLIDGGKVGFSLAEMKLIINGNNNQRISLKDDSLALHKYGVKDGMVVEILGQNITIRVVAHGYGGRDFYKPFPRNMSVAQFKNSILDLNSKWLKQDDVRDVWVFKKYGYYITLLDEDPQWLIGSFLCNNDEVHLVQNKDATLDLSVPCYFQKEEFGRVAWFEGETDLTLKLRVQGQFGFEYFCVGVISGAERYGYDFVLNDRKELNQIHVCVREK